MSPTGEIEASARPAPPPAPPPWQATLEEAGRFSGRAMSWIVRQMPKGLYARALIIIIAPVVLLQSVVTLVFMERHWQTVTQRLSTGTVQDIAMLIDVFENYPQTDDYEGFIRMAQQNLGLSVQIMPAGELPAARPKPFFGILDNALSDEIREKIGRPFWIDTVGRSNLVEIRVKLDDAIFRVLTKRSQTYASNSHIFLFWMLGTSLVLLTIAILFLRNQIKPILRLADAADGFGKGRPVSPDFRPRGAREVRQEAFAFIEMRNRIELYVEQRTTMLAGVSHDLRTVLTRFKLELAMLGDGPEIEALRGDVDEMQSMLEDYMAFAKGDAGEEMIEADIVPILAEIRAQSTISDQITLKTPEQPIVAHVKRHAFKRAIGNLVNNAARFADNVVVTAAVTPRFLTIQIEDNGPGIPAEEREAVFRPFYRIDHARNQDSGSTGLGLAIARDIARIHGGDIVLDSSALGGLRATYRMPL